MDILREFYDVRLEVYHKRKAYLEGQLTAESTRLDYQARFIVEKIEGKIVIGMLSLTMFSSINLPRGPRTATCTISEIKRLCLYHL